MNGFNITYEIVTPESAEHGDAEKRGFLSENITLREAMEELRWCRGSYVEADSTPVENPRYFTFHNAEEDFRTGAVTSYSLHLPKSVTPASRMRIARFIGCHGAR